MSFEPFSRGSRVRVWGDACYSNFSGGEEGVVLDFNPDARNYFVALENPVRNAWIAQRLLQLHPTGCVSTTPGATRNSGPHEGDEQVCRFCLDLGMEPLYRACGCLGSSQWVHRDCLRRWQIAVLGGNSLDVAHEDRHRRCAVCRQDVVQGHGIQAHLAGRRF
eukprot:2706949-Amphidinium_carterae.1